MSGDAQDIVVLEKVGLEFVLHSHNRSLRDWVLDRLHGRRSPQRHLWALKDVTLRARAGERIGVIGTNGAGKTTLLRTIAGVFPPTRGTVTCHGRIVPLLELGLGFNGELTAAENIMTSAVLLGKTRSEAKRLIGKIIEFAELEDFRDVAVKYYSSGMNARLAFSIAMETEPDILLLDEVFAVGDVHWVERAEKSMQSLLNKAKVIFMVSHNLDLIARLCRSGVYLDHGAIRAQGEIDAVIKAYRSRSADEKPRIIDNRASSEAALECALENGSIHVTARSLPVLGETWVGLFAPGADRDGYLTYRRVGVSAPRQTFVAPQLPRVEVRLYRWLPGGETLEASTEVALTADGESGHSHRR